MATSTDQTWTIPLAVPDLGDDEVAAVSRVLRSGWLTMGPVTEEFERTFAARAGAKHAFAVANCTAALHLANLALGIGPGDEVVCPTLTFVASANASRYTGAQVVLADVVGPEDLTIDPEDLERKITPRTKAVTVVHYAGFPCLMDPILQIAKRHGLKVIEDCAHAPLAAHVAADGSRARVGTLGDVGCFSFFGNKNMTTGEGGMVVTNDDRIAERIRLLRSHGMTTLSFDRFRGHAHGYDVLDLGYNYRSDDIHSAIGLVQLSRLEGFHVQRRDVYRWYIEAFRGSSVIVPFASRDLAVASPHIMSVVVSGDPGTIRERLRAEGIQTSCHYPLISSFSIYRDALGDTPKAAALRLVTLPFGQNLTREQVRTIAALAR